MYDHHENDRGLRGSQAGPWPSALPYVEVDQDFSEPLANPEDGIAGDKTVRHPISEDLTGDLEQTSSEFNGPAALNLTNGAKEFGWFNGRYRYSTDAREYIGL